MTEYPNSKVEKCYAPLGTSQATGVVLCVLPKGHEGRCDGGKAERKLGELAAALSIESEERWS